MEDILKYANITGALSTLKVGSRLSMPNLGDVLSYGKEESDEEEIQEEKKEEETDSIDDIDIL